jgi:hypothetical protein
MGVKWVTTKSQTLEFAIFKDTECHGWVVNIPYLEGPGFKSWFKNQLFCLSFIFSSVPPGKENSSCHQTVTASSVCVIRLLLPPQFLSSDCYCLLSSCHQTVTACSVPVIRLLLPPQFLSSDYYCLLSSCHQNVTASSHVLSSYSLTLLSFDAAKMMCWQLHENKFSKSVYGVHWACALRSTNDVTCSNISTVYSNRHVLIWNYNLLRIEQNRIQMYIEEYGGMMQGVPGQFVCTMPASVIHATCPETPSIMAPYFIYICCTLTNLQVTSQFFCKTYKTSEINIFWLVIYCFMQDHLISRHPDDVPTGIETCRSL